MSEAARRELMILRARFALQSSAVRVTYRDLVALIDALMIKDD